MQVAITGIYKNGQVFLDELPPIAIEAYEVMVVFLPTSEASKNKQVQTDQTDLLDRHGLLTMQELGGVLSSYCDGALSDKAMDEAVLQGVLKRAMMDNNSDFADGVIAHQVS